MEIEFQEDNKIKKQLIHVRTHSELKKEWNNIQNNLLQIDKTIMVIDAKINQQILIKLNDIISIESEDRMCNIQTKQKEMYLLNMRLKKFEEQFKNTSFIRINNTVMIDILLVESFKSVENARLEVVLKTGQKYFVNRYYKEKFKEKLL